MPRGRNSPASRQLRAAAFKEERIKRSEATIHQKQIIDRDCQLPEERRTALIETAEKFVKDIQIDKVEMSVQQFKKNALPSIDVDSTVWCQFESQIQLAQRKFEWNFQEFAFPSNFENWRDCYLNEFFHEKNPNSRWGVRLFEDGSNVKITLQMPNSQSDHRVRVAIAILNKSGEKNYLHMTNLPRYTRMPYCVFQITKTSFAKNFVNGKLTFHCEIENLIPTDSMNSGQMSTAVNIPKTQFSNNNQLAFAGMEKIFESMKFADININVCGCQFKAHKIILTTRSPFFAAMFKHQTEENLTNQVEIEDIKPDVFQELLHFIYTGRLSRKKMESKMPFEILNVAGKYLLDQLKMECETQLIDRISAENCVELLFFTEENHPAFYLKKYAFAFLRKFSSEVMATEAWEKAEQEHPKLCMTMLKNVVKTL